WLERYPRIAKRWNTLRASALRSNTQRVATTFVLGTYHDKQLDWNKIPPESTSILRLVIVLGTLLCVLLPIAIKVVWPPLSKEAITGVAGADVAGWSVWIWMFAYAVGWACALAGTAAASRAAFVPAVGLFVYFGVVVVAALSKTWLNALVAIEAAAALVYCESRRERVRRRDVVQGLLTSVFGGQAVAFALIVATPITAFFRPRLTLGVMIVGTAIGIGLWALAPKLRRQGEHGAVPVRLDHAVLALAGVHLLLLATLVVRGGLVVPAQGIASFSVAITGHLWPLYYFLGIGVMFKVLRQANTVQRAATELVKGRYFVPFTVAVLVVALAVAWSEAVVARPAVRWPFWLRGLAEGTYAISAWVWARPLVGFTMGPMKWILLLAFIIAIWAIVKRRFHSGVAAGLLFTVILLWLAVFEYFFEYTGFSRSYQHNALSFLVFSAFVLWLTYRTAFDFVGGSSTWWPGPARVALYASGVLFVLLPVHARAALHDGTLPNEIFLYLFFGVIDLGLPYYLYVYAQRRFQELPLSVPAMLGLFGVGAALSVPLIVLDKLALARWSTAAMWQRASEQATAILAGTPLPPLQAVLPPAWLLLRGLLVIALLVSAAVLARRYSKHVRLAPAVAVFSAVAVGAGLASFSNRSVDLPLMPLRIVQLITPLSVSLSIDAALIARHLSYFLPAMLVGLMLTMPQSRVPRALGVAAAYVLHASLSLTWPRGEAWLRSTGALVLLGTAGVVLFIWLTAVLRDRLDAVLARKSESLTPDDSAQLLPAGDVRWLCITLLLVLSSATVLKAYSGRLRPHRVVNSSLVAQVPAMWQVTESTPFANQSTLALVGRSYTEFRPVLWTDLRHADTADARAVLQRAALETAERVAEFEPLKFDTWDQFYPGSLLLDFRVALTPSDTGRRLFGTMVLAPVPNGQALVAAVIHDIDDRDRRWDLARILGALPRPAYKQ
ncbi:MAG: hypothetical protein AB1762_17375, partial [Gemmatimonadota bacterium]